MDFRCLQALSDARKISNVGTLMQLVDKNLIKITDLLSDGHYRDKSTICNQLHIDPETFSHLIDKLIAYLAPLDVAKDKGYALTSPLILLDSEKIQCRLPDQRLKLVLFEKIESTNQYLRQTCLSDQKITVCLAEMQTHGRGRGNRLWHSPFGANIYLSLCFPCAQATSVCASLSLVMALSVCKAIESVLGAKEAALQVKWPNDVLLNHQKLSGILIEKQGQAGQAGRLIVGVGVNVNMTEASAQIDQAWTSLFQETGTYQDRNHLCVALITHLIRNLAHFLESGFESFREAWQQRDYLLGKPVLLLSGHKKSRGICGGVNRKGALLLETEDSRIHAHVSGRVSLTKDLSKSD